jgi:hypothetical protein
MSGTRKAAGPAALVLADGAVPLRPDPALFEAMLEGWRRQQAARRLTGPLIEAGSGWSSGSASSPGPGPGSGRRGS